jgi:hypothetical protein
MWLDAGNSPEPGFQRHIVTRSFLLSAGDVGRAVTHFGCVYNAPRVLITEHMFGKKKTA